MPGPTFQPAPRIFPEVPEGTIEIPKPAPPPDKPSSWAERRLEVLWSGGRSLVSVVFLVGGSILLKGSGAAMGTGVFMLLGGATLLIIEFRKGKKEWLKDVADYEETCRTREDKHRSALQTLRGRLQSTRDIQFKGGLEVDPAPEECFQRVKRLDSRLWEREPEDEDFLSVRVGTSEVPLAVEVDAPEIPLGEEPEPFLKEAIALAQEFKVLPHYPIVAPIGSVAVSGVVGKPREADAVARSLLIQLATHHSPAEVKIVSVLPEQSDWDWLRWLPHTWDPAQKRRYLSKGPAAASRVLGPLAETVRRRREQTDNRLARTNRPHYVFLFPEPELVAGEPVVEHLLRGVPGCSTLFLRQRVEQLPREAETIVEVKQGTGQLILTGRGTEKTLFEPDLSSIQEAERTARAMTPIQLQGVTRVTEIPDSISLLELLDAETLDDIDFLSLWDNHRPFEDMSVPIGAQSGGRKLFLNLHERTHGPHGLVAGTTGSGKTAFLSTLLALYASYFHPHEVNFVAIDYKGGDLYRGLDNLPHLVGTITNLEKSEVARCLKALQGENERRQKLFNDLTASSGIAVGDIDTYQRLVREGRAQEPLPKLLLVADEFAELAKQEPEFLARLVSIARVGRSLGVHLILATQQPAGVITSQIESNTRFRISFKFNKDEDSKAVLKRADAATLKRSGRAFFQLGENEQFEKFQAAWGGAPYQGLLDTQVGETPLLAEVLLDGSRVPFGKTGISRVSASEESLTQLQAVASRIARTAREAGIKTLPGPWLPPLAEQIPLGELLPDAGWDGEQWRPAGSHSYLAPIGRVDDPGARCQETLRLDLPRDRHFAVYARPGSGATTFLQTLIVALARLHSPEEVQFYLLECGGRGLGPVGKLPHVGALVALEQTEVVDRLFSFLRKRLEERRSTFARHGATSFAEFRDVAKEPAARVVIVIDGYHRLSRERPELDDAVGQLAADGGNLGFHLVFTAHSPSLVKHRTQVVIGSTLALQLNDAADYTLAVGRLEGFEPPPHPGRGVVSGKPPLEFQTALPVDTEDLPHVRYLHELVDRMKACWKGPEVPAAPAIPDVVTMEQLLEWRTNSSSIPVALNLDEVVPIEVDLSTGPHFAVTGSPGSGKSNFLKSWLLALAGNLTPEQVRLVLIDFGDANLAPLEQLPHCLEFIDDKASLVEYLDQLSQENEKLQKELRDARKAGKKSESSRPLTILAVDNYQSLVAATDLEDRDLFQRVARQARGLNLHILFAGSIADLSANSYDPLGKALMTNRSGFLLGTREDKGVFGHVRIPVSAEPKNVGEGFLIRQGSVSCPVRGPSLEEGGRTVEEWVRSLREREGDSR